MSEGSNKFLNNKNALNTITFNTNTDFFKRGNSNVFLSDKIIHDFNKITSNELSSDNISDLNNKNKFIKNNFYNSDLNITGFLRASNVNDINLENLRETVDVISIGQNTEVVQSYDINTFNVNTQLSNMEIKFSSDNNVKIPFIVINNCVGIHNVNPKYELDVSGVINCSNILLNGTSNISNMVNSTVRYDANNNVGIGTNIPTAKLHIIGNVLATGSIISSFSDILLKIPEAHLKK
jgi:hypothetical protein